MPGESPKCVAKLTARIFSNGLCKVEGIPMEFAAAMDVCKMINYAVSERFIRAAKDGKLDDDMVIEKDRIVRV